MTKEYMVGVHGGVSFVSDTDVRQYATTWGFVSTTTAAAGGGTTGYIKVWTGSAWELKPVKYWNGSAWVQKPVKFWNGSAWVLGEA